MGPGVFLERYFWLSGSRICTTNCTIYTGGALETIGTLTHSTPPKSRRARANLSSTLPLERTHTNNNQLQPTQALMSISCAGYMRSAVLL